MWRLHDWVQLVLLNWVFSAVLMQIQSQLVKSLCGGWACEPQLGLEQVPPHFKRN